MTNESKRSFKLDAEIPETSASTTERNCPTCGQPVVSAFYDNAWDGACDLWVIDRIKELKKNASGIAPKSL